MVKEEDAGFISSCLEATGRRRLLDLQITLLFMGDRLVTRFCRMTTLSLKAVMTRDGAGDAGGRGHQKIERRLNTILNKKKSLL